MILSMILKKRGLIFVSSQNKMRTFCSLSISMMLMSNLRGRNKSAIRENRKVCRNEEKSIHTLKDRERQSTRTPNSPPSSSKF